MTSKGWTTDTWDGYGLHESFVGGDLLGHVGETNDSGGLSSAGGGAKGFWTGRWGGC